MRLHLPLVILIAILLVFCLVACDRDGSTVNVGGGDVVMNPGEGTTTTQSSESSTSGTPTQPSRPQGGGGVDLPYLPT